jgi:hypothetical protein
MIDPMPPAIARVSPEVRNNPAPIVPEIAIPKQVFISRRTYSNSAERDDTGQVMPLEHSSQALSLSEKGLADPHARIIIFVRHGRMNELEREHEVLRNTEIRVETRRVIMTAGMFIKDESA